jgi:hypothetical protein
MYTPPFISLHLIETNQLKFKRYLMFGLKNIQAVAPHPYIKDVGFLCFRHAGQELSGVDIALTFYQRVLKLTDLSGFLWVYTVPCTQRTALNEFRPPNSQHR